jgi:predicted transposase YbfD/YdcC
VTRNPVATMTEHFGRVEDPRIDRTKLHKLIDIIVIAICAAVCGTDGWVGVETFGDSKADWLGQFLELPNGIPSHDTFGRVFRRVDPEQFRHSFMNWIRAVAKVTDGQVIALDGKQLRRSHDKELGKDAIYMVSAWATANHLVLGQTKVDEKSNEITALPKLLQVLELSGCIVTVDAIGSQKKIAHTIRAQGGDYVLPIKGNQAGLFEDIHDLFQYAESIDFRDCDYYKTVDKGHGRIEVRECWTISHADYLPYLRNLDKWQDLRTIAMIKAKRQTPEETTIEVRYFISSLPSQAERILGAARTYWGIENGLHWVLDVAFREDDCRIRKGYGAQNFAVLRRIALNLPKQEQTAKCGIKNKRLRAGWDQAYLFKVLNAMN